MDSTASSDTNIEDTSNDDGRRRVGQHTHLRGPTPFDTDRTSSASSSVVLVSNGVSTHSQGSDVLSYPSSTDSIPSSTPSIPASEARYYFPDTILQSLATGILRTAPVAASPPRQISRPSTSLSSISSHGLSDADKSTNCSEETGTDQQSWRTPATSGPSLVDDNASQNLDQEDPHRIEVIPEEEALNGLSLSSKWSILASLLHLQTK